MDDVGRRYWTSTVDSMETQNISMIYQVRSEFWFKGRFTRDPQDIGRATGRGFKLVGSRDLS